MMFTLDRSMHLIEATEQNVLAIYRSVEVVSVSPPGAGPQNSEAFVSVIMEDDVAHVYVALIEASSKQVHIFTSEKNFPRSVSYTETLKEGVSFAESMGFAMESVNLNYGKALKEVIVRSMRIFTTPSGKKKGMQNRIPTGKQYVENIPAKRTSDRIEMGTSSIEDINSKSFLQDDTSEELAARDKILAEKIISERRAEEQAEIARSALERAEAERTEREKLLLEKAAIEKIAAEQIELERRAREKIEAELIERDRILAEKVAAERAAAEHIEFQRRTFEKNETERIERERDLAEKAAAEKLAAERAAHERLRAERDAAEKLLAQQADVARQLREKAQAERIDSERFFSDKAAAVRLAEEKAERARQAQVYAEAEKTERESMLAEKAFVENLAAEQIEAARLAWEKAEAERVECENQLAEKTESLKLAVQEAAAAQLAVTSANAELNKLENVLLERTESEKLAAERAEAERLAWEAAQSERAEIDRLVLEKGSTERIETESFRENIEADKLSGDSGHATEFPGEEAQEERGTQECNSVENSADEKIAFSRTDAARSVSELGESGRDKQEKRLAARATVDRRAQELVDLARLDREIDATGSTEQSDAHAIDFLSGVRSNDELPFFGYREATTAVRFSIVAAQLTIDYDDAAEEIESLHQSLNMVRVTIEGFPSQNCTAFICAVKRAGTHKVYVALYLDESNRALIYLPEKQPESVEECDGIINDGIVFTETAGFMMAKVGFDSKEKLAELLEKIPVFGRKSDKT